MKTLLPIGKCLSAFVLLGWCTTIALAQTVEDFDTPADPTDGTPYIPENCNFVKNPDAPGPEELPSEPPEVGYFLRLVTTVGADEEGIHNSIAFDLTDPGLFSQIVAEFDFRMTPGPFGKADGFGFALLNTVHSGNSGAKCPPSVSEEPNFTGSLGVGFDIYQNTDLADINDKSVAKMSLVSSSTS